MTKQRTPKASKGFEKVEKLSEHFYGTKAMPEIKSEKSHGFAHARTPNAGHTIYGKPGKGGHMLGRKK